MKTAAIRVVSASTLDFQTKNVLAEAFLGARKLLQTMILLRIHYSTETAH
jgi:hypothetical protein